MKPVFGSLLVLLLAGCATERALPPATKILVEKPVYQRDVTREAQGWRLVERGALLIDVRDPEEYRAGHLESAVNIPLTDIVAGTEKFRVTKKQLVVVYGSKAQLAGVTNALLIKRGYANAHSAGSYEGMLATRALTFRSGKPVF